MNKKTKQVKHKIKITSTNLGGIHLDFIAQETIKNGGRIPASYLQLMTVAARKMTLRRAKYLFRHQDEMTDFNAEAK